MARCCRVLAVVGAWVTALVSASGCEVAFTEPMSGTVVDARPYLGLWTTEMVPPPGVISVSSSADGWLRVEVLDAPGALPTLSFTATVTSADGLDVAWLAAGPGLPGEGLLFLSWPVVRERVV